MSRPLKSMILSFLFSFFALVFVTGSYAEEAGSSAVITLKNLNRWPDPVIIDGKLLEKAIGKPICNLRVYAFHDSAFDPIRFQIDEMTGENGDWVLPNGPKPNGEMGNAVFDAWDKLVFMADDTGDKCNSDVWTPGYSEGIEIEVTDPMTNEKGWCYLLAFNDNPPKRSALPDYIQYDYDTETMRTDYFFGQTIITEKGEHSNYYKSLYITKKAGGNEKNFVDRLKIRGQVKLFFGSMTINLTEGRIKGNTLAYKAGPVRLIRRLEQYVQLPGGIKALRAVADINQYRNIGNCPAVFQIPFRMDRLVSSFVIRFGTDFNENAFGAKIYNSNNTQGFLVDGKMDENELNHCNPSPDSWRLITGDIGTFMNRTIPSPEVKEHVKMSMGIIDDITKTLPPETYPGTIGCLYQDWDVSKAPKGKYVMFLEFYWIPNYAPGDEAKYINYMDHPVRVRVGNREAESRPLLIANFCDKYK